MKQNQRETKINKTQLNKKLTNFLRISQDSQEIRKLKNKFNHHRKRKQGKLEWRVSKLI